MNRYYKKFEKNIEKVQTNCLILLSRIDFTKLRELKLIPLHYNRSNLQTVITFFFNYINNYHSSIKQFHYLNSYLLLLSFFCRKEIENKFEIDHDKIQIIIDNKNIFMSEIEILIMKNNKNNNKKRKRDSATSSNSLNLEFQKNDLIRYTYLNCSFNNLSSKTKTQQQINTNDNESQSDESDNDDDDLNDQLYNVGIGY